MQIVGHIKSKRYLTALVFQIFGWMKISTRHHLSLSWQQRLLDKYHQSWSSEIINTAKLELYCSFREEFKFNKYLNVIKNEKHRTAYTQIVCSAHNLEIETGRRTNTLRNEGHCKLCKNKHVESEFHYILLCPAYLRMQFLPKYATSFPTKCKLSKLFKTNKSETIINISKYLYHASERRAQLYKEFNV